VVDDFLEHEQEMVRAQANERAVAYIRNVQEWTNLFQPSDFAGWLRSVCARAIWDKRFARDISKEKDETDELSALIVQKPNLLAAQLDCWPSPRLSQPNVSLSRLAELTSRAIAAA